MNKLLKKLARKFLCPLNIHIKKKLYCEMTQEILFCELCDKYKNSSNKWVGNPY